MYLEIIIVILLGLLSGTFTGLIPGIHINLIASLILVNFAILSQYTSISLLIIFIITMGTTHSFISFIPSVLFGVPSADTSLSVLPAHQLVLEGKAYLAIHLSSIGSLFGMFFAFLIAPILYFTLESTYDFIKSSIPFILIFTLIALILLEKELDKIFWASIIVVLSGSFGMLILNSTITDQSLLILFSGLFGVAGIFQSLRDESSSFPKQSLDIKFKLNLEFFKSISIAGLCSSICSISPGIGNAQAGTLAALFYKKIDSEIFIVVLSAINTINFILSFLTFYIIERARNGAVFVISQIVESIKLEDMYLYFGIIFVVASLSFLLTLYLGKFFIYIIQRLNFKMINLTILIFLFTLIYFITNWIGILILLASSLLGILCVSLNVRRVHLMGVLLIPVIFNLL